MSGFAVVGVGAMGQHHARIYFELGVLSAICDTNFQQAKALAAKYKVSAYDNMDDLLWSKPEGVSIAVPTPLHLGIATECVNLGANVLIEKPISDDTVEARKFLELAKQKDKVVCVGYVERFNPAFQGLKRLIDAGEFGDITSVNIKRVGGEPRSANNIILDLMTHDINLLLNIFKRSPKRIWTHKHEADGIVNSAQTLFDFGTASATCEANWISPVKIRTICITGTKGYAEVDMIAQKITEFKAPSWMVKSSLDHIGKPLNFKIRTFNKEPLKEELAGFIKAVRTGDKSDIVDGIDAIRTLETTLWAAGEE